MTDLPPILAAVLPWVLAAFALALVLNAWRLLRGPGLPDRVLALDTLYVNSLALLVVLGLWLADKSYFEVALLMRNRFYAFEVYDEWFAHKLTRAQWREVVTTGPGMERFRHVMFQRLVPNLREIGLLSPRIRPHYERAGLSKYFGEKAADSITAAEMLRDLDATPAYAEAAE